MNTYFFFCFCLSDCVRYQGIKSLTQSSRFYRHILLISALLYACNKFVTSNARTQTNFFRFCYIQVIFFYTFRLYCLQIIFFLYFQILMYVDNLFYTFRFCCMQVFFFLYFQILLYAGIHLSILSDSTVYVDNLFYTFRFCCIQVFFFILSDSAIYR